MLIFSLNFTQYSKILILFFQFSQEWSARVYIFPIVTFSLLFNSPKFFEMEASVPFKKGFLYCRFKIRTIRNYNYYIGKVEPNLCGKFQQMPSFPRVDIKGKNIFLLSQTAYENVTHVQDQNTSLQQLEVNMTLHSISNQVQTTKWRIRLE